MKKILRYLLYGLIGFTIIGIIAVATDKSGDKKTEKPAEATQPPADISYTVTKKEMSRDQLDYRITLRDRIDKESLIEIVRKLKKENSWKEKLVCFFDINVFSQSNAWASVAYLPECKECETDKDADGNAVRYQLIGLTKAQANSLQQLTFDTIPDKKLVASYIEDLSKCKTQLFIVNSDPSKLLLAQLFDNDGHLVQWLRLKDVNGEKRYYFDDEEPGKENYLVINSSEKLIHYKDYEDKNWMSYGYE